jgi:hypothetical protein
MISIFNFKPTVNIRSKASVGFLLPSSIMKTTNWLLLGVALVVLSALSKSKYKSSNLYEKPISKT